MATISNEMPPTYNNDVPAGTISIISKSTMDDESKPALPDSPEPIKDQGSSSPDGSASIVSASQITRQKVVTTLIICFCNLINFMDRYALPGIDIWWFFFYILCLVMIFY